jgi:hypothetical protein
MEYAKEGFIFTSRSRRRRTTGFTSLRSDLFCHDKLIYLRNLLASVLSTIDDQSR